VNYTQIQKFVDDSLMKKILKENADFIMDRQIFSAQFFMLIKLMMQTIVNDHCMGEHRFSHEYKMAGHCHKMKTMALQISSKVMLDFLSHFFENSTMQPICESMNSVMTFSDSYVSFATQKSPSIILEFIKRTFLADNC